LRGGRGTKRERIAYIIFETFFLGHGTQHLGGHGGVEHDAFSRVCVWVVSTKLIPHPPSQEYPYLVAREDLPFATFVVHLYVNIYGLLKKE